jgi:prepilin-type processing-associated H-X9-DG protein
LISGTGSGCTAGFASYHPGGMNMLFCDGHLQFVVCEIDSDLWTASGTIAGGEGFNFEF